MNSAFLDILGVFVRYVYIKYFKKKDTELKKLWEETKFDDNLEYLKLTNKVLGFISALIITIIFLLILPGVVW